MGARGVVMPDLPPVEPPGDGAAARASKAVPAPGRRADRRHGSDILEGAESARTFPAGATVEGGCRLRPARSRDVPRAEEEGN